VTLLVSLVLRPSIGLGQQIKTDGTVGTATTLTGPAYTIPSTLGTLQGTNLFHSFSLFNVPNPGSATFTRIGAPTINNVIARVTGGQQSSIDGLLRLAAAPLADPFAAGTNFFLINPSGVVFGANASLSVTGSFHVSTADYLGFPGNRYSVPSVASELLNLSTAAPTSFGFLSSTPAAITIQGNATAPTLLVPNSASNLARTLSVVGGNIQITGPASATGATILAPRGLVQVVSVASAGEATIGGGPINVSQFTQLGQISMTNKAVIAATANNTATAGGTVLIRAGRLIMNDSSILSNARAPVAGAPRAIDIGPAVDMQLTNNTQIRSETLGAGVAGGEILINASSLSLTGGPQGGSQILRNSQSLGTLPGGGLTINVTGPLTLCAFSDCHAPTPSDPAPGLPPAISNLTQFGENLGPLIISGSSLTMADGANILSRSGTHPSGTTGFAGDINVAVGPLTMLRGANITASASSNIAAPKTTVTADSVFLSGHTALGAPSGIMSTTAPATAVVGDISLDVRNLTVTDGAVVGALPSLGSGSTTSPQGGNVIVKAREPIVISAGGAIVTQSGRADVAQLKITAPAITIDNGFVQTSTVDAGKAGDINVTTDTLNVIGGGQIQSSSVRNAPGAGGNVTINVAGSVSLAGAASGVFSTADVFGTAGRISVTTPSLTLSDGAKMSVTTHGTGAAGDIVATLGKTLSLTNGGQIQSNTTNTNPAVGGAGGNVTITANESVTLAGAASGIFSTTNNIGNAGRITATTPSLTMSDGAKISVSTQGGGTAGDIALNLSSLALTGGARIDSDTAGGGHGGNVTIAAPASVNISGATVSSNATASGEGGNIKIDTAQMQLMSQATLSATSSGTGNAGKITVTTPSLAMSDGSKISVNTQGAGAAGDITLDLNTLTLAGGARIDSGTQAGGHGGTVTINAGQSVSLAGAAGGVFSTAESTGNAGTITVTSPTLTLGDGAKMSVTTQGGGAAGDIALNLGSLALAGGSRIDSGTSGAGHGGHITISAPSSVSVLGSGVSSNATAGGAGGNVSINTPQMALTDHATLSATSTGTGNAGNIAVVIGNSLRMRDSAITTSATTADGGNISITTTGSQLYLLNGKITTSVQSGFGQGGNIIIGSNAHPIEFVILSGSEIRADAFGGPGGNIDIFAGTFLTSSSILSASSALGVPGTIGIQAGVTDVSSSVSQLPESVLQAATLLRAACATRLAGGGSSSLVVSAREGLPAEPGGVLPSPLLAEGPADSTRSQDEGPGHDDLSNRIALWVPAPRCLR